MRKIFRKYCLIIGGAVLGALGGFLYWHFIGCFSGQCMITSVWYNSVIYGSVMGGLLGSTFTKSAIKSSDKIN